MTGRYKVDEFELVNPMQLAFLTPFQIPVGGAIGGVIAALYFPDADIHNPAGTTVNIDYGNGLTSTTTLVATENPYLFLIYGATTYNTAGLYTILVSFETTIPGLEDFVGAGVIQVGEGPW